MRSKSVISFPVLPSNATKRGAELYPLPDDVIPIVSIFAKLSTFKIWGRDALGVSVLSVGKSYPMSFKCTFLISPMSLLTANKSAFTPLTELTDVTSGKTS